MKQRWLKSVMNAGLIIVLTIGLCACGSRENDNREDVNADLAIENVYSVVSDDILPWVDCEDSYINVQSAIYTNEGVYAVMALRNRLENKVYYAVLTAGGELSDLQITPLKLPEDIQESLADGENDVTGEEILGISSEGDFMMTASDRCHFQFQEDATYLLPGFLH